MKISNSKKELARIISENGGWRELAESAAQCIGGEISFWHDTATKQRGEDWCGSYLGACDDIRLTGVKLPNWHQAILSSAEYFHLYPATDADGWIEWSGGECPVGEGDRIDVKFSDGDEFFDVSSYWGWGADAGCCNIIAYRQHKPEQVKPEFCESVMRSIPEPEAKPTLDQLLKDWRNADDCAKRKQAEADEAAAMRDERWQAVQDRAGEVGVTVGVCERVSVDWPKLVITDCRYLKVKDEIEVVVPNGGDVTTGERGCIVKLSSNGFWCNFPSQKSYWYYNTQFERGDVKFIRRQ